MKNSLKLVSFLFPVLLSQPSFACSSCGSSATSPLVLKQNENLKVYAGISENYNYMNYGIAGGSSTKQWLDPEINTKQTMTLGLGYRTSENSFVTVMGSVVRNEGLSNPEDATSGIKSSTMVGDPIISGRYNLLNMNFEEEYRPQIQLVASYKPGLAKNMVDGDGDAIETTGNGFHQASGGVDVWFGMPFIQFGAAQFITYSFDRHPDTTFTYQNQKGTVSKRTRDLQYTTVLTVGHAFPDEKFSLSGGVVLDNIGKETSTRTFANGDSDSVTAAASEHNDLFVTLDWNATKKDMVRFSYTYGGFYGGAFGPFTNSAQTTSNSVLVAYERTLY